ncbi:MAG: Crp/Fnr family transcriptional regulator [Jannaschia sp.]
MAKNASCLVQKMSHYIDLDDANVDHLEQLEKSEKNFGKNVEIYRAGDSTGDLFVVKSGWLFSYTDLPDGRRQIVKLHHPGDIVGMADLPVIHATTATMTVEDVCLCPFPKSGLDVILRDSPRLTALLLSVSLRDQVVFTDLLRAMGRMSAKERIGYLLLDLLARLRITNTSMTDTIRLPLNQSQIGDYLGLTNVYVSKTLINMEKEGYIRRNGNEVQIVRRDDLVELTDFSDRYEVMDTSWFPEAQSG